MKTTAHALRPPPLLHPPPPALHPELQQLIERGLLSRAEALEISTLAVEIDAAARRGELTLGQAEALGQMLGLRYGESRRAERLQ